MHRGESGLAFQEAKEPEKSEIFIPTHLPENDEQNQKFRESLILLIKNQDSLETKSNPEVAKAFESLSQAVASAEDLNIYVSKFLIHSPVKEDFLKQVPRSGNSAEWIRDLDKEPKHNLEYYPDAQSSVRFAAQLWHRVKEIQAEHEIDNALDFESGNVRVGDALKIPAEDREVQDLDKMLGIDKAA